MMPCESMTHECSDYERDGRGHAQAGERASNNNSDNMPRAGLRWRWHRELWKEQAISIFSIIGDGFSTVNDTIFTKRNNYRL